MPIEYEAGWVPETVWAICSREKYPAPAGIRTPDRLACSVNTIAITLCLNKQIHNQITN